ncbi:MAG TPA: DNA polymerase III subunit epsilon [Steroidobacteraceae bacterium]|nr:DNA polymerase III subunit epsilon [Steroidobacteraceae bacterium]
MRQVVLDTETTGLEVELSHRVIEIGCVELFNRRLTGRTYHQYLNPERDIEVGAQAVHGLTREKLAGAPTFSQVSAQFLEFIADAELIIHNAPFDVAFLNAEFERIPISAKVDELCRVLDTLALARRMHPGQRNSLDALCKRYSIDNSHRDYHGALLDARLLAEVYLVMTGGQANLTLSAEPDFGATQARRTAVSVGDVRILVIRPTEAEMAAHEHVLALLDKASAGNTVWRKL